MFDKSLYEPKIDELIEENDYCIYSGDKDELKELILDYLEENCDDTKLISNFLNKYGQNEILIYSDDYIDDYNSDLWCSTKEEYLNGMSYGDILEKEPIIETYIDLLKYNYGCEIYDISLFENYYIIIKGD